MAYEIPYAEPASFAAGDRVQWKRTLADFPISEGWTLKYYLRGNFQHDPVVFTATSAADYEIDLTAAVTAELTPGVYFWQAYVELGADRKLIGEGRMVIGADFSTMTHPHDGRSHARRCLEAIQAVIEGRATTDMQRYALQAVGRSVDKMSIKDLLAFRDYYLAEVNNEEGKRGRKNIFVHFHR